jgi:diguanylate cyclase (GGDEF)-like protein
MRIDLPTLYALALLMSTVNGLMLLFSWLQNRTAMTLVWWGSGILVLVFGSGLVAFRGIVPASISVVFGSGLWLAGYGLMWCGARVFEGRMPLLAWSMAGPLAWAVLCQSEAVYGSQELRVRIFSVIALVYTLLIVREYWRAAEPRPASRWLAVTLMLAQAAINVLRIPFAARFDPAVMSGDASILLPLWVTWLLLHTDCMAFLVMAMAKERLELQVRKIALVDPLTGIANRRAFFEYGERILGRLRAESRPAALLMIDLDLFKSINDTYGHETGDHVLHDFCAGTAGLLRPTDLFARTGGEEFVCLLPDADTAGAMEAAERIRARFATLKPLPDATDAMTVSIGVATTTSCGYRLDTLMGAADRALYAAKKAGRNRVEWAADEQSGFLPAIGAPSMVADGQAPVVVC